MKTIKLTNFEIQSIINALENPDSLLYTKDSSRKLPINVLWRMDENIDKLRAIRDKIQSMREKIEKGYIDDEHSENEVQEDGTVIRKIKSEFVPEFNRQIIELMNIVNEIEFKTIDISVFENRDFIPSDYRSIRFMLVSSENDTESKEEVSE